MQKEIPRIREDAREMKGWCPDVGGQNDIYAQCADHFLALSVVFEHQAMFCLLHYNRLRRRNSATQNGA